LIATKQYQEKVYDLLKFNVPKCSVESTRDLSYPTFSPFPMSTTSKIKMCYQLENGEPLTSVYNLVANGIVSQINSHYSASQPIVSAEIVLVNTTKFGFFTSLVNAVNSGQCDVVVADVSIVPERLSMVQFQTCPYGATSLSYIRTGKDNETLVVSSVLDLNRKDLIVAVYEDTIFEAWVNSNLPLATLKKVGYNEQFEMVVKNQAHAIIGDAVDFQIWLSNNQQLCPFCKLKAFGEPSTFGSFVKKVQKRSSGVRNFNMFENGGLILIIGNILIIVLSVLII
jgi:hypothetical protein